MYQIFLCFFEKASVIRALTILLCFNNLIIYYCVIASIYFYLNGYALQVGRWPPRPVLQQMVIYLEALGAGGRGAEATVLLG